MTVEYTNHLRDRLALRGIDYDLPEMIYIKSKERYYDVETGHSIAVMNVRMYGKNRECLVAYVHDGETVKLLTIHPLKDGQKDNRLQTGRWREET
jgi:hypothetical protein